MAKKKIKLKGKRNQRVAVSMFRESMFEATRKSAYRIATDFRSYIVNTIKKQRYKWKPLTKRYLRTKRRKRLDLRIYIATGESINSIKVLKTKKGYTVGPKPGRHSLAKMSYRQLFAMMEFGTKRMPARPLWRTAIAVFVRRGMKKVKQ